MKLKNFFKSFCFVLACILMLSTVIIPTTAESTAPDGSWANYVTEVTVEADNSYIVDTAGELAWLLNATLTGNPTVYITDDIDLSAHYWPGIASFSGTIIGKKDGTEDAAVTISGMTSEENLNASWAFILASSGLTMQNVKFTGANGSILASAAISVICAEVSTSAVFKNVTVSSSTLNSTKEESLLCVGGVIGRTKDKTDITMTNVMVSDLTLNAKTHAVGGVIGRVTNNSTAMLQDVHVTGLTASTTKTGVGGIIGRIADGGSSKGTILLDRCFVANSMIESTDNTAGGLVGFANVCNLIFMNCELGDDVTIKPDDSGKNIGAYFGEAGNDAANNVAVALLNCKWSATYDAFGNPAHQFVCYTTCDAAARNNNHRITFKRVAPIMLAGASIRTNEGTNGLRFTSTVDDATAQAGLNALGATVSYGTLICQADQLEKATDFTQAALLASGSSLYTTITAKNGVTTDTDGNVTKFNAALVVDLDEKATEYAARSYADITITMGNKTVTTRVYSDYSADDNVRSMEEVANAALADVKDEKITGTPDGYDYIFAVTTLDNETKYSCYSASEYEVLKTWASATETGDEA